MRKLLCLALVLLLMFPSAATHVVIPPEPRAMVMLDMLTGRVLLEKNKDEQLPVASTTKIMTALLTLEQPNPDEYFVVDSDAIKVEGSSMGLREGDSVTLYTLAVGMMMSSGNDAAHAAAVKIAGSVEAFAVMMNERAADIGMTNTNFTTPSGLDYGDPYSSAHDMGLLAAEALKNEQFAEIVRQQSIQVAYGNPPYNRTLSNHNRLLDMYPEANGIKTGFTERSGRCLVSSATVEGQTLVTVTLDCADDFNVHKQLYTEMFDSMTFIDCGRYLSGLSIPVVGGESGRVGVELAWQLGAHMTVGEVESYKLEVLAPPFLYAPVEKGQTIGEAVLMLDGVKLGQVPLLAASDVEYKEREKFLGIF